MIVTLPVSKQQVEITQIKPAVLERVNETLAKNTNSNSPYVFRTMFEFVRDLKISHLTLKDVEYAVLVRMALSNKDTYLKLPTKCGECGHIGKITNVDVMELPIGSNNELTRTISAFTKDELIKMYPKIKLETSEMYESRINELYEKKIITIKNNIDNLVINSITFRLPTLEDAINSEELKPDKFSKNILMHTIENIEYEYDGAVLVENYKQVIERFNYRLFDFTVEEYNKKIVEMFNDCGISPLVEYKCERCSNEAITSYDFISFFIFGILPSDMKRKQ